VYYFCVLLWDSKAGAVSNWSLTMIAKYYCLGTDRLMIARGKHYKGEGEECNNSPSCGIIVLIAILNLLIFTSLPDWHEECHSGDGESHEDCIACLIVSGSIDSMVSCMDVEVVRDQASQVAVYSSEGAKASQDFWVILAARPPPTVI